MAYKRQSFLFPIALSPASAATALELPIGMIRRAIKDGSLEAIPLPGGRVRIPVAAIVPWLRSLARAA